MTFKEALDRIQHKNILLLQGPVGPFFYYFGKALKKRGSKVFKLNFNGGDFIFYPFGNAYTKPIHKFATFLEDKIKKQNITCLIMFNDCRPIHKIALKVAKKLDIDIFVFEEGYIRPNFITLEKGGVNAFSNIPKNSDFYLNYHINNKRTEKPIRHSFRNMAFFSFLYWFFSFWLGWFFNNSLHHRSLSFTEMFPWFLSAFRKQFYKITEKEDNELIKDSRQNYFVAVLQVHNDTQIKNHFDGKRIEKFIKRTIISFSRYSKPQHFLVIKHHPMDRGYRNYKKFIKRLSRRYNISNRVIYVHDTYLPTLLHNALGCVVINSTTGLSALLHKCPTKVCGKAFYDIEGLTFQGSLDKFWRSAKKYKINHTLYKNFRDYLIDNNQINGSFYVRIAPPPPRRLLKTN
ncbi:capsule biosynthesis protein [Helicobacter valdiviensis]|uniref:Capsule biosynthesis protein n=1 Tax=Helicobacter valdiviensis TaxID=1458358 RepID=A0A2W6MWW3_9HELI|nr:capsular biosynthesis protein [Helicobacter valdiviensis]PZT48897.1 capsule biosynthesis protein [Helicobacter valdiviensis]